MAVRRTRAPWRCRTASATSAGHHPIHRGEACSQVDNFGDALADPQPGDRSRPARCEPFVARGLVQQRQGAIDVAPADFDAALNVNPRDQQSAARCGRHSAIGTKAIEDFNAVIQMDRNDPSAFFNRGYAHFGSTSKSWNTKPRCRSTPAGRSLCERDVDEHGANSKRQFRAEHFCRRARFVG